MTARVLYNEIDPYAAEWLRNLIAAGHIAPGDVCERDVRDLKPDDLRGYTQFHAFAGIGIWPLALRQAGVPDSRHLWSGSCPCQPFSEGGLQRRFADERHLWPHWHHLIDVCRPPEVLGEQVANSGGLAWLDLVQADLEGSGYTFGAADLCAAGFGAPHRRQRLYFVAYADDAERRSEEPSRDISHRAQAERDQGYRDAWERLHGPDWLSFAAGFCSGSDGDPCRLAKLRTYGNAIVSEVATSFVEAYLAARADLSVDLIG